MILSRTVQIPHLDDSKVNAYVNNKSTREANTKPALRSQFDVYILIL